MIDSVSVMAVSFRIALITIVSARVLVTDTVYVPSVLSTIALTEALPVVVIITVSPPMVRLFPCMSIACTVIVDAAIPSAVTEVKEADRDDVVAFATPGIKVIEGLFGNAEALSVALTTTVSARVLVTVAE